MNTYLGDYDSEDWLQLHKMLFLYRRGAFPMSESRESETVEWYMPQKRTVILTDNYNIPRSLQQYMRKIRFEVRIDYDLEAVLEGCAKREKTWISHRLVKAYRKLFESGHLHTFEVYRENQLAGGLYGITSGAAFIGESMFSYQPQASKIALATLLPMLAKRRYILLDVQYPTDHLKMFGTVSIDISEYLMMLAEVDDALPRLFSFPESGLWFKNFN